MRFQEGERCLTWNWPGSRAGWNPGAASSAHRTTDRIDTMRRSATTSSSPDGGASESAPPRTEEQRENKGPFASLLISLLFTVFALPGWLEAVRVLEEPLQTASVVTALAYTGLYVTAIPVSRKAPPPVQVLLCTALFAFGLALIALMGVSNTWVLIFALAVIAVVAPIRTTTVVTVVTLSGLSAFVYYFSETFAEHLADIALLGAVTAATALACVLVDTNAELRATRDEVSVLAVAHERERFARDLHDLLGHSLTTIVLKASAIRRVVETSREVDHAVTELRELEGLGRQALTDVRAAVNDFRVVLLSGEIAKAAAALRTADISADLPRAVDNVAPQLHGIFGYVLREAVTNIIRHAQCTHMKVRLGTYWIEVEDNGTATKVFGEGSIDQFAGNGLRGLKERLQAVGGSLHTHTLAKGGLVIRAAAFPPEEGQPAPITEEEKQG